jgi:hypothetical protein
MAITPDGRRLLPMLEGALTTDPDQRRLIISEFDLSRRRVEPPCDWRPHDAHQSTLSGDRA